ncbi:MAG TPA: hypothetical protein PK957_01540 [Candidatus Dojkabacteria bacterium]|nr:hypothetical protein [Candidatus Dojkabacteria bacterium]
MKINKQQRIAILLLLVDFLMLLLHLVFGKKYGLFNIDWERNVPTMYQAFKLIVVGSICLSVFIINHLVLSNKNKKDNYFWIGLTIFFIDGF